MEKEALIFGGSFNPPTLAHQEIMRRCLRLGFSELWVMPSGERLDKSYSASDQDRLNMLNLIKEQEFNNEPSLIISDFELSLPRPSETYRTVNELELAYAGISFYFAFGSDAYRDMPKWRGGEELQRKLKTIVFARSFNEVPNSSNVVGLSLGDDFNFISSTLVRESINKSENIDGLVCASVAKYIEQKQLYLPRFLSTFDRV